MAADFADLECEASAKSRCWARLREQHGCGQVSGREGTTRKREPND
ncbi:hypothetical protein [Clostridium sp. OM02-18AC]|nr:hypothetical protein [Clostridium sp. OM02-18AC]